MTCQFYNPATRHPAGARSVKGRGTRNLAVCAAALLAALTTTPSAAQVWIGPVYGPPAACPAPACRPPVSCWGPPATFAQPGVPTLPSWPSTIGGGTPVTTFYPPATLEDAAPLLQQISGSVRVIIPEAFLNRLLARSETDTGPVVDNILGANVTGSQNTNTTLSVDVTECPQLARMQLQLTGTTQNQTIGVTP